MSQLERADVNAWWQLAQTDARVAQLVMDTSPPAWHLVCFLSQQAGEKAIKALLELHHQPIPRSHDITLLVELSRADVAIDGVLDDAILLSGYGVIPRYPHPSFAATRDDAVDALTSARRLLSWAELVLRL